MPRIFGTIDTLEFDAAGYTAAMRRAIERRFRVAAKAFLRAAIPKVPVQTGMARGSFLNIGVFLGVAVPISPTRFNQRYAPTGDLKSKELGAALSTPSAVALRWRGNQHVFEFQSRVFHLTLMDVLGVSGKGGPWGAFRAGRDAFSESLRDIRSHMPRVGDFLIKTTISFGRGSVVRTAPLRERRQERVGE